MKNLAALILIFNCLFYTSAYADSASNLNDITKATGYVNNALQKAKAAQTELNQAIALINKLKQNCKAFSNNCDKLDKEINQLNKALVSTNKEFHKARTDVVDTLGAVQFVAKKANLMLTAYEGVSNPDSMTGYIAGLHTLATTAVDIGKGIELISEDYHLTTYSRTSAEIGFLNSDSTYLPQGNLVLYPWGNGIGIQGDISGGKIDGDTAFNYGGHVFWRNPESFMLGATIANINRGEEADLRYGLESEFYNIHKDVTLRLEGGYQNGHATSSLYGGLFTTWYPRLNLDAQNYGELADVIALKAGVYGYKGTLMGTLGMELQTRDFIDYFKNYANKKHNNPLIYGLTELIAMPFQVFPRNSTFFINGAIGSSDLDYILMGVNVYLGSPPKNASFNTTAKALKKKHRTQFIESSLFVDSVPK